mgnify:FL=1
MEEMKSTYLDELSLSEGAKTGLSTLFDFAGIPTDTTSTRVAVSGIPAFSLMEAFSDGRLSQLMNEIGQAEPIDIEAMLTEQGLSPEIAGLGALAAGMVKGRGTGGIFDMLKGAMDPSTIKKYDDKEFMDFQKGSEDVLGSLRSDRDQEWWDSPEADDLIRREQWERARKMRDDPGVADELASGGRPGLYANINAKRKRIAAGSGERMRSKGEEGAPTAENFKEAAKTAKMNMGGRPGTRRRKRMMVPASYKTGGQVFQKGYYGKSYK